MTEIRLPGLDGTNPLAFFAALGALEAAGSSPQSTLRWTSEGTWHPVIVTGDAHLEELLVRLDRDRIDCIGDPMLAFEYSGKRDLKARPDEFRRLLSALVAEASPANRRTVDWAMALATDIAIDNNGNIKPTALHFTAGQQQFLQMASELVRKVTVEDLREALLGPWTYSRPLPVLGWDSTSSRDYALRASNPSTDKKLGVPGADWLALRGLVCIPSVPSRDRILTTGCEGGWKTGQLTWPLWTIALSGQVIRSLLSLRVERMSTAERSARGIGAVMRSGIRRSEQGGYGSFEPATIV